MDFNGFSGVFRAYKKELLTRNGLIQLWHSDQVQTLELP